MSEPKGFITKWNENKVFLLKKLLYGLKQSPRQWYFKFDEFMLKIGFTRSNYDNCVYYKWKRNGVGIFLLLYVNEMLVTSIDKSEVQILKK